MKSIRPTTKSVPAPFAASAPVPNTQAEFAALIERAVERVLKRKLAALAGTPTDGPPEWLSSAETAAFLRCSRKHLGVLARRGDIPSSRFGRLRRFSRFAVDAYLREHQGGPS